MKKLRLTINEEELLMRAIKDKLVLDCKHNISEFEYTSKDVKDFLNETCAENIKKPTLNIAADVYTKMFELVKQSEIEISWHGLVKRNENSYLLYDILLFPQINSPTNTTTDEKEFADWQTELIKDMDFPIEDLRMHGHSHVNMNVYSSATDDKYQSDIITKVEDGDYYIFLVLNKRQEMCCFIYDFEQQIVFETKDVDIKIIDYVGKDIKEWCTEEIKKNCSTFINKRHTAYNTPKTNHNSDLSIDKDDNFISKINANCRNFLGRK